MQVERHTHEMIDGLEIDSCASFPTSTHSKLIYEVRSKTTESHTIMLAKSLCFFRSEKKKTRTGCVRTRCNFWSSAQQCVQKAPARYLISFMTDRERKIRARVIIKPKYIICLWMTKSTLHLERACFLTWFWRGYCENMAALSSEIQIVG